jgi:hypothetical protein
MRHGLRRPFLLVVLVLIIICFYCLQRGSFTRSKESEIIIDAQDPVQRGPQYNHSNMKNGSLNSRFPSKESGISNRTKSHLISLNKNNFSQAFNHSRKVGKSRKKKLHSTSSLSEFEMPYIVGSMTTTPKRLDTINGPFGETLKKLLSYRLLNKMYLNIPWVYNIRKKSENITLSIDLLKFVENSKGRLVILRCLDYGPSTKLLPLLHLSNEELPLDAMIITFDDDRLYRSTAIQALVESAVKYPDSVITIAAWPINILSSNGKRGMKNGPNFNTKLISGSEGTQYSKSGPVDLILGFFGVLYRKKFFSEKNIDIEKDKEKNDFVVDISLFNYSKRPEFLRYCAWVDDIWFSGHLERLNVGRYVIGKKDDTGDFYMLIYFLLFFLHFQYRKEFSYPIWWHFCFDKYYYHHHYSCRYNGSIEC